MKALQPPSPKLPSVVPLALLTAPRWLLWKAVPNADKPGAKPRKVPHYIDSTPRRGTLESEKDLVRLACFDDAWRAYLASPEVWAGVGFAVIGEGIAAFDLDYVLDDQGGFDPDTEAGRIADWALAEGLYMEISPSGTGLRIFGQASILDSIGGRAGGTIEYYAKGKFLTVTGNLYANEQGWGNLDKIRASIARPAEEVTPTADNTAQDECTNPRIVQDLRSALFHLSSDERDLWQRMGHALKTLGDSGRGLWLDWSATSEKFDPADAARAWKSFKPERTSYQAVFAEATRRGWINPSKNYSNLPVPSKARETCDKLLIPVPTLLSQPAAPQWLVRGFLEKNTLGMIFGASGHGKSFIGLALAASVATGTDFFGHAVALGGVVYVAGEGHHGIARRLKAWEMHAEQKLPDSFTVSSRAVRFLDTADMELLASEIEAMSVRPTLIVVDTVARAMVGADENSSKEMGIFIEECDALKRRFNCTLLLIHHSGHGEATRARGSSSLKAALDFEASVTQQECSRRLVVSKMKDAEPPSHIDFELLSVELPWTDDDGEQVRAAVAVQVKTSEPPPKKLKMSASQRIGVQTLLSVANNGTATLEVWRREFYKRHTGDSPDAKKKAFQRVRKDLTEAAAVTVEDDNYTITPEQCVWVDFAVMVKADQ